MDGKLVDIINVGYSFVLVVVVSSGNVLVCVVCYFVYMKEGDKELI